MTTNILTDSERRDIDDKGLVILRDVFSGQQAAAMVAVQAHRGDAVAMQRPRFLHALLKTAHTWVNTTQRSCACDAGAYFGEADQSFRAKLTTSGA